MPSRAWGLVALALLQATTALAQDGADLLGHHAFLMTHDSASGYLSGGLFHPVNDWAKTQAAQGDHGAVNSFAAQAACGARAFDVRPFVADNGQLVMHHGSVVVEVELRTGLSDIVSFAMSNPSELLLVVLGHFTGTNCSARAFEVTEQLGIDVVSDCAALATLNVTAAMSMASLPGGGHVLAISSDCVDENYDSSIECYHCSTDTPLATANRTTAVQQALRARGAQNDTASCYCCYGDGKETPLNQLWTYVNETATRPSAAGRLWMNQAHWQYSTQSVAEGVAHLSSIVNDEQQSGVNKELVSLAPALPNLNLLEVDYVCDHGPELYQALKKRGVVV